MQDHPAENSIGRQTREGMGRQHPKHPTASIASHSVHTREGWRTEKVDAMLSGAHMAIGQKGLMMIKV